MNAFPVSGTLKVIELNRLGRAGFCTHGGYNLLVNVVMKVVAGIFRKATMKTSQTGRSEKALTESNKSMHTKFKECPVSQYHPFVSLCVLNL